MVLLIVRTQVVDRTVQMFQNSFDFIPCADEACQPRIFIFNGRFAAQSINNVIETGANDFQFCLATSEANRQALARKLRTDIGFNADIICNSLT